MRRDLFIDGEWRPAESGARIEIHDPATREPVGTSALAAPGDIDAAVAAATRAFPGWAATHPDERARLSTRQPTSSRPASTGSPRR